MKKFLALVAVMLIPGTALAGAYGAMPFALYSGASAAVITSSQINVRGFKTKTMQVEGATLTSNPSSITFKNLSGTVLAQCSQDGTSWETCIANDYGQTAVSRTTNGLFTWSDAINYIRLKWTAGTKGGKLKAWFSWLE